MENRVAAGQKFAHTTEVVGVAGRWHQMLSPTRLLVSFTTYRDHPEMDGVLRSALDAIAST
jgi:hypothetical protein